MCTIVPGDLCRAEIERGTFTVDGTVSYDGRKALKIIWTDKSMPGMVDRNTLLVDVRTYGLLRWTGINTDPTGRSFTTMLVFGSIPATPSALRALTPPIPPGFTQGSQLCH